MCLVEKTVNLTTWLVSLLLMNMRTVRQVIGSTEKAPGTGEWSGRIWALQIGSKSFLNFCLLLMCVLLLERENLALRGEVALGGNEKALGLYIEMWWGREQYFWTLPYVPWWAKWPWLRTFRAEQHQHYSLPGTPSHPNHILRLYQDPGIFDSVLI